MTSPTPGRHHSVPGSRLPRSRHHPAAIYGAAAYGGNGPGDLSDGPIGTAPRMTFLYDPPATATQTTIPAPPDGVQPRRGGHHQQSDCQRVPAFRSSRILLLPGPDQPIGVLTFNADWQGGQDPLTQRNDATIHDYYIEAEGPATLSVAAINCTNWNVTTKNPAVGNWLAVSINGSPFVNICTDQTVNNVGTIKAPATLVLTPANADDTIVPPALGGGGREVKLTFLTKAFSNRPPAERYPTGNYNAQVYVWSSRAKNSVPGYCVGSDFFIDPPSTTTASPVCTVSSAAASSANPYPLAPITLQQMFNVNLSVFDTTQNIQITPNACPTGGIAPGQIVPLFATVSNSENVGTGNRRRLTVLVRSRTIRTSSSTAIRPVRTLSGHWFRGLRTRNIRRAARKARLLSTLVLCRWVEPRCGCRYHQQYGTDLANAIRSSQSVRHQSGRHGYLLRLPSDGYSGLVQFEPVGCGSDQNTLARRASACSAVRSPAFRRSPAR